MSDDKAFEQWFEEYYTYPASRATPEEKLAYLAGRQSGVEQIIELVEGETRVCINDVDVIGYADLLSKLKALQSDASTGNNQTEAGSE